MMMIKMMLPIDAPRILNQWMRVRSLFIDEADCAFWASTVCDGRHVPVTFMMQRHQEWTQWNALPHTSRHTRWLQQLQSWEKKPMAIDSSDSTSADFASLPEALVHDPFQPLLLSSSSNDNSTITDASNAPPNGSHGDHQDEDVASVSLDGCSATVAASAASTAASVVAAPRLTDAQIRVTTAAHLAALSNNCIKSAVFTQCFNKSSSFQPNEQEAAAVARCPEWAAISMATAGKNECCWNLFRSVRSNNRTE